MGSPPSPADREAAAPAFDLHLLEASDFHSFHDCYAHASGRPVRLTGQMDEWPIMRGDALTNTLAAAGSAAVDALRLSYSREGVQTSHARVRCSLEELLARSLAAPAGEEAWYLQLRGLPLHAAPADAAGAAARVAPLVRRPPAVSRAALRETNAWIGCSRTSHIHFDGLDNWLAIAYGEKEVHLYHPSQLPHLYPQLEPNERWKSAARSRLYLPPSGGDFPLLREAPFLKLTLSRGEMLYIPAGWWHEVFTPTCAIAFNFWFTPHPKSRFRATILHLHSDMFARRCIEEGKRLSTELKKTNEAQALQESACKLSEKTADAALS
ncbi:hypothetical protein AB1Y20_020598 [Prymnesium parvum]|uniref:JmjC domain-containing protein n=1 Tax=Prymnesium parvum TaxID=97485 RepID=A0AB34JVM3_PRYPA